MEILHAVKHQDCVEGCNTQWLCMARDILHRNGISGTKFAEAVRTLLIKGRGKNCNWGKTFLLNPLNTKYRTSTNPVTTSFAWVGAELCEVIFFLMTFVGWRRLSLGTICYYIVLLEGQTVHLPAPKSQYSKDIEFKHDAPIFCTGKDEIVFCSRWDNRLHGD